MILHDQASLADLSDELVKAVTTVSRNLENIGVKPKIVPSRHSGTVAFSLRSVLPSERETVATMAWKSLGADFLVHLFQDRFIVQHKKTS